MMTFITIVASVISFIEVPRRNEVCSYDESSEGCFPGNTLKRFMEHADAG